MTAASLFRNLIVQDPTLPALLPAERWRPAGSMTEENAPERMFAVIRWGVVRPGIGVVRRVPVTVWIHDNPGSYEDINAVIQWLNGTLDGREGIVESEAVELTRIEWEATSGDLSDTGYRTITRNVTFNVVGKGV